MNNIKQSVLIILAIVALIGFGEYRASAVRHDSRIFFCNELETIKKGERSERRATLKEARNFLKKHPQGTPDLPKDLIERSIRRSEKRLVELAPDIERCLSA